MQKPEESMNLEHITTTSNAKIPRSVIVFFFILQFCFGINFGFNKCLSKKLQLITNILSVLISLVVVAIICAPILSPNAKVLVVFTPVSQYVLCFFILNLTKHTFYDFVLRIHSLNEDIPELTKEIFGVSVSFYTSLLFLAKYIVGILHCLYMGPVSCKSVYYIPYYIYGVATFGVESVSVILLLIYYYLYSCVKKTKEIAIGSNVERVKSFYLYIAESYKKILPLYDRLTTVILLFEGPKLMAFIWYVLFFIQYKMTLLIYITKVVFSLHIIIRIVSPAVITEMVNSQVKAIEMRLHYEVLIEEDKRKYTEILRLLRYMKARRLEHKLWRVIPLDLRLPVTILSMCTTYLIVIIQFTHLFE